MLTGSFPFYLCIWSHPFSGRSGSDLGEWAHFEKCLTSGWSSVPSKAPGSRPHPVSVPGNLWPPPVLTEGSCSPLRWLLNEHTGIPVTITESGRPASSPSPLQPGKWAQTSRPPGWPQCLNSVWMEEMEPQHDQVSSPLKWSWSLLIGLSVPDVHSPAQEPQGGKWGSCTL